MTSIEEQRYYWLNRFGSDDHPEEALLSKLQTGDPSERIRAVISFARKDTVSELSMLEVARHLSDDGKVDLGANYEPVRWVPTVRACCEVFLPLIVS